MSSTDITVLTADNVERVFKDCLVESGTLVESTSYVLLIEGIVHKAYLHKGKLEEHRPEVEAWITQLQPQFLKSGGGGWSFLNLCDKANGEQWTGMHQTMEHLCMLAIGLDLASFPLPRSLWDVLPGGMPYVIFNA